MTVLNCDLVHNLHQKLKSDDYLLLVADTDKITDHFYMFVLEKEVDKL